MMGIFGFNKDSTVRNTISKNYTSVTLTRIFRILVGIFGLGSFVRDRLLENFRLGYFVWELSFGILRLGTFA